MRGAACAGRISRNVTHAANGNFCCREANISCSCCLYILTNDVLVKGDFVPFQEIHTRTQEIYFVVLHQNFIGPKRFRFLFLFFNGNSDGGTTDGDRLEP